jgi:hypothetical protein
LKIPFFVAFRFLSFHAAWTQSGLFDTPGCGAGPLTAARFLCFDRGDIAGVTGGRVERRLAAEEKNPELKAAMEG